MAGRRATPRAVALLSAACLGACRCCQSAMAFAPPAADRRTTAPLLPPRNSALVSRSAPDGLTNKAHDVVPPLRSSNDPNSNDDNVNGGGGGVGGSLTFGGSTGASLLNEAFSNLDVTDQYDAVLTGLCAKILDGEVTANTATADTSTASTTEDEAERVARDATSTPTERAYSILSDPLNLLQEMNSRKVRASPRSLGALIDAAVSTEDVRATASVMRLAAQNSNVRSGPLAGAGPFAGSGLAAGGINNFGGLQGTITALPTNPTAKVLCPDGVKRTKSERLAALLAVPTDDRAAEVVSALATVGVLSTCLLIRSFGSAFGYEDAAGYADLLFGTIITIGFVDNFYDAIKGFTSLIASTQKDKMEKIPDAVKNNVGLPEKEGMPLGLGTGTLTGTVVRGLTRLVSVDTERECECEAAAFFVAYGLGLPCFGFRPNALEAAVLVFESTKDDERGEALDPLLSDVGILKVLIWLMAPVAMESSRHAQLIASDPREGPGLLRRLREKARTMVGAEAAEELEDLLGGSGGGGGGGEEELEDLLKWAYAEADLLLRDNRKVVDELTERLAGGAATVGDCVAVLEGW